MSSLYSRMTSSITARDPPDAVSKPRRRGTGSNSRPMSPARIPSQGQSRIVDARVEQVIDLHEQIQEQTHTIDSLQARNEELEMEVLRLQRVQFQKMPDARHAPMEDLKIKERLGEIRANITAIGKQFVPRKVSSLSRLSTVDQNRLAEQLSYVGHVPPGVSPASLLGQIQADDQIGRLYFTALLSRALHHEVMENPFFFLLGAGRPTHEILDCPSMFADALSYGRRTDLAPTNLWRSQTLRLLFPHRNTDEIGTRLRSKAEQLRERASDLAAARFMRSPAALLAHFVDEKDQRRCHDEVLRLFDIAAELSMQLWRQRVELQCHHLADLTTIPFSATSDELEAHPRHKLDDEADTALDGKHIRIVVHPSVRLLGTHEGERFSSVVTVLAKAMVCLDESITIVRIQAEPTVK